MPETNEVMYLCNGGKNCGSSKGCYVNGGNCYHTNDISMAAGFEVFHQATKNGNEVYFQKACKVGFRNEL